MRDNAGLRALKKIDRKVQHLVEHVSGKLDVDARCQIHNEELAHIGKHGLENDQHRHGEAHDEKRVVLN